MDIADKDRLSKLLGMLGSSFDGERSNAAAMIQKMAEKHKMTINELVATAHGSTTTYQSRDKPRQQDRKRSGSHFPDDILKKITDLVFDAESDFPLLTPWEQQFVSDISKRYKRDYELSEKQLAVCERIIDKADRAGFWDGEP